MGGWIEDKSSDAIAIVGAGRKVVVPGPPIKPFRIVGARESFSKCRVGPYYSMEE